MNNQAWAEVVAKLIGDTKSKKLVWSMLPDEPKRAGALSALSKPIEGFSVDYADKTFEIKKSLVDSSPSLSLQDKSTGNVLTSVRGTLVDDLHAIVKGQATGVDDFFHKFLNDN